MNCKKFEFFTTRISYFGHVIHPGRLEVPTRTIDAIRRHHYPTIVTELRSFSGLCNVFGRFVPRLPCVAVLLNKNIRKGQLETFDGSTDDEITALQTLKARLMKPPVLAVPSLQGPYTVGTDACDKQNRCVFLQKQHDGARIPIGYRSR